MKATKPYLIGITGGSASGKTHFLRSLLGKFSEEEICLMSQDEYYKEKELQPKDERGIENFDTPLSIDLDRFVRDLKAIKAGETVHKREYTFNNPYTRPKMITYNPAPVIVVEGIFILYYKAVTEQLDLKVFLDAKEYIKLTRRIKRDKEERGYEIEDVLYRYEHHVAPTYEKYIEPFKHEADFIIPNNEKFDTAMEVLVSYLKQKAYAK